MSTLSVVLSEEDRILISGDTLDITGKQPRLHPSQVSTYLQLIGEGVGSNPVNIIYAAQVFNLTHI